MTRAYIVIAGLCVVIVVLLMLYIDSGRKLHTERDGRRKADSVHFNMGRQIITDYAIKLDRSEKALKASELARADEHAYHVRKQESWARERAALIRERDGIHTESASTAWLDSTQLAMFGTPADDSTHTIPLDYSRKLTGDALRLPIEQRLSTRAQERLDSAESHYGRMIGSMTVDMNMLKQDVSAGREAMDAVMKEFGEAQAQLNAKDRAFRRQRRRERAVEIAVMIGLGILVL